MFRDKEIRATLEAKAMADELTFRFPIPKAEMDEPLSFEEAERRLLADLHEKEAGLENAIFKLVRFYSASGRQDLCFDYAQRLLSSTDDPEKLALYYLTLGQLMEQIQDYQAAIIYYRRAFEMEPATKSVWYLVNNNLGYCLNIGGAYEEAEPYLRAAIRVDPDRHNAYKNLGISLQGQGDYVGAAQAYFKATLTNSADSRALRLLEVMLRMHPEITECIPDIHKQIAQCWQAVQFAAQLWRKSSAA